jgi:hypothetical protein
MQAVTTIGLDIAKSVFQVHGIDAEGWEGGQHVMQSRSIRRSEQPTCASASQNAGF